MLYKMYTIISIYQKSAASLFGQAEAFAVLAFRLTGVLGPCRDML